MNLIELARSYLTPEVVDKASALVGDSPTTTRKALEIAVPTVVAELSGEGASASGGRRIMGILQEAGLLGPMSTITERLSAGSGEDLVSLGKDLLGKLFGGRLSGVTGAAATAAGVKSDTMGSLLGLAGPLVFGVLGSQIHARRLDTAGLAALLGEQKTAALAALPAPLAMALQRMSRPGTATARTAPVERGAPEGLARFWPLLLVIPLAILGALFFRKPSAPPTQEWVPGARLGAGVSPSATPEVTSEPAPVAEPMPLPITPPAALPGGSIGHDMAQFLASSDGDPSKRFVFDHLNFELARVNLMPGSARTLDDVAEVLKAYPEAEVVVEGHTDTTGDAADNQRLSLERADVVKAALVARGISADRVKTAGIGQDRPVASNDTVEGRARNRRTELIVTRR
jgi:OmpA-OmpF porin, OOP family